MHARSPKTPASFAPVILPATLSAIAFTGCAFDANEAALELNIREQPMSVALAADSHDDHDHQQVHAVSSCADHADQEDSEQVRQDAARPVHWKHPSRGCEGKAAKVKILGFNDFHGQLSAGRFVAGRPVGGAAVLASYLESAAEAAEDGSLIIHAGDHVGASPPASALLQDEPSITFLNLLTNRHCRGAERSNSRCNVVGTLGNHEFDEGKDEMLRLIYGGQHENGPFLEEKYRGAKFPYVSSNVVDEVTGQPIVPSYVIRKLGEVKIGIIGAVLEGTPSIVTPTGVAGLAFLNEAESINKAVAELKKKKVKAIGVTIHQGGRQSLYDGPTTPDGAVTGEIVDIVAALDSEIDFVVAGHAHSFTNALLPGKDGSTILVTQAFSASTAYGEIDLTIDTGTGDVIEKTAQILTTYADEGPGLKPNPSVLELVSAAEGATDPLVSQVIADAAADILREENEAGESALGNLIADAQRAATGADIAFMNPGGIRADLFAGEVTWGELFTIQPFGNSLVTMDLTGAQIIELLNQQWVGQSFPRIMKPSGIEYTWDSSIEVGKNRIVSALVGGVPLDLAATYRVTVNSFLAAGGDNFLVLPQGTNRVGGDVDLDALIAYVQTLTQPFSATVEGRMTML